MAADPPADVRAPSGRADDPTSNLVAEVHTRNRAVIEAELDRLARRAPTLTRADLDIIDAALGRLAESLILAGLRSAEENRVPLLRSLLVP